MKKVIYQVKIGKSRLYDWCTNSVQRYAERIGAEYIQQTNPILCIKPDPFSSNRNKQAWEKHNGLVIYEKQNAFAYLKTYDQVAVIDSDIFIRPGAASIFDDLEPGYDFGAVVERDMPITDQYKAKIHNYSRMQYGSIRSVDWKWNDAGAEFMNMGVMVLNKSFDRYLRGMTPKQFLMQPRFKPFVDGQGPWKWSTDQTLMNTWIREVGMKIKPLDWRWNALYKGVRDNQLSKAFFVHFFLKDKLPSRGENIEQLQRDIT